MFDRTPKWVKKYPHDLDKAALTQLAKASKGLLKKPREMIFTLYGFTDTVSLENAIGVINEAGWECSAQRQLDEPGKYLVECKKSGYSITEQSYHEDTQYFLRIAEMYKVGYDGWHASQ